MFSQFTTLLTLLRARLNERKVRHEYLDGKTPAKERARAVDRFQTAARTPPPSTGPLASMTKDELRWLLG